MKFQVVLETKFDDYIENAILVEVETEEQAIAVVKFIREDSPRVIVNGGYPQRIVINNVDRFWGETNFTIRA